MSAYKLTRQLLDKAEESLVLSQVHKFNDIISTRFSLKMLQCVLYVVQGALGDKSDGHQFHTCQNNFVP